MAVIEDNLKDIYDRQYRAGVEWPLLEKLVEDVEEIKEGGSGGGGGTGAGGVEVIKINDIISSPTFADSKWSDMTYEQFKSTVTAGDKMYVMMGDEYGLHPSLSLFNEANDGLRWVSPTVANPNTTYPARLDIMTVYIIAKAGADGKTVLETSTPVEQAQRP